MEIHNCPMCGREWYLKNMEKILAKIKAKRDMKNAED